MALDPKGLKHAFQSAVFAADGDLDTVSYSQVTAILSAAITAYLQHAGEAAASARSTPPAPAEVKPLEASFDAWWSADGQYIDPDTADVPWFDKRRGLAQHAYGAGCRAGDETVNALSQALKCCVESLNIVAQEITGSPTGTFEVWSHPANSIRMAQDALTKAAPAAQSAETEAYTAAREAGTPIIDTFPAISLAYLQHAGEGEAEVERVAKAIYHGRNRRVTNDPIGRWETESAELRQDCLYHAQDAIAAIYAAAPHPHHAPEGWQDISTAPKDRTPVLIAVPTKDRDGHIVGEAYFDPENNEGGDWWWAGTGWGDYQAGPISEMNHHVPTHWRPLPAPPASPASADQGGE